MQIYKTTLRDNNKSTHTYMAADTQIFRSHQHPWKARTVDHWLKKFAWKHKIITLINYL